MSERASGQHDDTPPAGAEAAGQVGKRRLALPGASIWLLLSALLIALDQWSKRWVLANLEYGRPNFVNEYLDLTRLHNEGAAFSFLANAGGWQKYFFITLSGAVTLLLLVWLLRLPARGRLLLVIGLACILAGAVGNLVDRVLYGYVVDFLHFHYQQHFWPAFNVADIAISVGAGCVNRDALVHREEPGAGKTDASDDGATAD